MQKALVDDLLLPMRGAFSLVTSSPSMKGNRFSLPCTPNAIKPENISKSDNVELSLDF